MASLKIVPRDSVSDNEWKSFVKDNEHGNIFQTPEMWSVYENTKGYSPIFVGVSDSSGELVGVVLLVHQQEGMFPINLLTSRVVTWGGPLINSDYTYKDEAMRLMLAEIDRKVDKPLFIQFRNMWDFSQAKNIFEKEGYSFEDHLAILLNLTQGKENLLRNMRRSKRKALNTAKNKGVTIEEVTKIEILQEYYKGLAHFYKTVVKKPLPDWSFFESLFKILAPLNMAKFFVVKHEDKIIGGSTCVIYKKKIYEWYAYGDRRYKNLYPSEMATWAPIEWGLDNKMEIFDFMGGGRPEEKYGVRDFKLGFGGKMFNFGRFTKITGKLRYFLIEKGYQILTNKKL